MGSNLKCQWQDCKEKGEYDAPKSIDNIEDRIYFCKEHVREYNLNWNYFANMSSEEIMDFQIKTIYDHRPTRKMGVDNLYEYEQKIRNKVQRDFFSSKNINKNTKISLKEKTAYDNLNLSYEIKDFNIIKKHYKLMAKKYHPDNNKNISDEKFKIINNAYNYLKNKYGKK